MRNLFLAAGVAALALAAPAMAERGGKGGGDKERAASVERGGGKQRAQKTERGRQEVRAARIERRGGGERARIERRGGGERLRFAALREERGRGRGERAENRGRKAEDRSRERRVVRVERREREDRIRIERRGDRDRIVLRQRERDRDGDRDRSRLVVRERDWDRDRERARLVLVRDRDRDRAFFRLRDFDDRRDFEDRRFFRRFANRGIPIAYFGCPSGLVTISGVCIPPGQAKRLLGQRLPAIYAARVLPLSLRNLYRDDDDYYYRWGDGYVYRVDRDTQLIAALLPLIGAGFGIGQPFPYMGSSYYVPSHYRPFYLDTDDDYYRYANGYVYEIDGDTGLIEDMIPLLDHGYGVGQILPASYSYYNVPYQYRSLYYDTPDYSYRYAPGVIYQVDRDTSLITAIASLLTGGLAVGQPLPPTYSAYNVPLAYRGQYYDRPDMWYRYSDGYIYQVDPRTQLITAIVDSIV